MDTCSELELDQHFHMLKIGRDVKENMETIAVSIITVIFRKRAVMIYRCSFMILLCNLSNYLHHNFNSQKTEFKTIWALKTTQLVEGYIFVHG